MRRALPLLAILGLWSCGHSPATQFFTMDPAPSSAARVSAPEPIHVDAVHLPASLDRPQMVRETAPERIAVDEQQQWAAPLGDILRRALSQDLADRLMPGFLAPTPERGARGVLGLVLDVQEFQPEPDGRVRLVADWSLLPQSGDKPVRSGRVDLRAPEPSAGGQAQAASMSELVGRLADSIVSALRKP